MIRNLQLTIFITLFGLVSACQTIKPTPIVNQSNLHLKKLAVFSDQNTYKHKPQFAMNGTIAVAVAGSGLLFLDPKTGDESYKIPSSVTTRGINVSNNGLALIVFSKSTELWDLNKNKKIKEWFKSIKAADTTLSENGQYAVVDEQLWDVAGKNLLGRVPLADNAARTLISPNNQFIVSIGMGSIVISKLANLKDFKLLKIDSFALDAWYSPNSRNIIVSHGSQRDPISTMPIATNISIFELNSANKIKEIKYPSQITSVAISQITGDILISSKNGSIDLLRNNDFSHIQKWQISNAISTSVADSQGRIWLASSRGDIFLYNANTISRIDKLNSSIINILISSKKSTFVAHVYDSSNPSNRGLEIYQIM